ncbi:MAG: hypothetical protein HY438_03190 [DPANN group archaeon]|nr:hypothetical protein [DPANN group archaeon]
MHPNKKLYVGLGIFILIIVTGVIFVNFGPNPPGKNAYNTPSPEDVVRQYFESWNARDWPNMYATISDGFKKIDPAAKDFATFKTYAESQNFDAIKIISIRLDSKTNSAATVSYVVELTLASSTTENSSDNTSQLHGSGNKKQISDKFTLKYRDGDIIRGWKLIHPYGQNIDTS